MIEAAIGAGLGVLCVVLARSIQIERWFYALGLLSLPVIYLGFAVYAGHWRAAALELVWGTPYLIGGVLLSVIKLRFATVAVAALWLTHGAYDLLHHAIFENPGVPSWYPVLCAAVDIVVGSYLLIFSARVAPVRRNPLTDSQ